MAKLELGDFGVIRLTKDSEFITYYDDKKSVIIPKGTELSVIMGSQGMLILNGENTNCTRLDVMMICANMKHCVDNGLYKDITDSLKDDYNHILSTFKLVSKEKRKEIDERIEEIENFYEVVE